MQIKLSVTGLAKFMNARPAAQRSLLKAYKFSTDSLGNKRPQIVRYSEARAAIQQYHDNGNKTDILKEAILDLRYKEELPHIKDAARIRDNMRAINNYMRHYSQSQYVLITRPRLKYKHLNVEISATPDLFVDDDGIRKLIKLHFNASSASQESIKFILKIMHEASSNAGLRVDAKNVIFLDLSRNQSYSGSPLNKNLRRDVNAACENIADIWPHIKSSPPSATAEPAAVSNRIHLEWPE
jgi:hypothetical protein